MNLQFLSLVLNNFDYFQAHVVIYLYSTPPKGDGHFPRDNLEHSSCPMSERCTDAKGDSYSPFHFLNIMMLKIVVGNYNYFSIHMNTKCMGKEDKIQLLNLKLCKIIIEGIVVNDELLDEVSEISGVMAFGEDYLPKKCTS